MPGFIAEIGKTAYKNIERCVFILKKYTSKFIPCQDDFPHVKTTFLIETALLQGIRNCFLYTRTPEAKQTFPSSKRQASCRYEANMRHA
jgi:hypothetical protein